MSAAEYAALCPSVNGISCRNPGGLTLLRAKPGDRFPQLRQKLLLHGLICRNLRVMAYTQGHGIQP
jgi:hypothetical protein